MLLVQVCSSSCPGAMQMPASQASAMQALASQELALDDRRSSILYKASPQGVACLLRYQQELAQSKQQVASDDLLQEARSRISELEVQLMLAQQQNQQQQASTLGAAAGWKCCCRSCSSLHHACSSSAAGSSCKCCCRARAQQQHQQLLGALQLAQEQMQQQQEEASRKLKLQEQRLQHEVCSQLLHVACR